MTGRPESRLAELPPVFDWSIYASRNADLTGFDQEGVTHHYDRYGRNEGRISSAIGGRSDFLKLIPPGTSLLEIGPFCTPCFTSQTHRVRFLDAFPTEELRKIAGELSWGRPDLVPDIDYVWRGEPYTHADRATLRRPSSPRTTSNTNPASSPICRTSPPC